MNRSRSLVLVAGSGRSGTGLMTGTLARLGFHVPQPGRVGDTLDLAVVRDAPVARIRNVHGFVDPSLSRSQPDWGDASRPARLRAAVRPAKSPSARLLSPLRRFPLPIRRALPLRGRIAIAGAPRRLEPRRLVCP